MCMRIRISTTCKWHESKWMWTWMGVSGDMQCRISPKLSTIHLNLCTENTLFLYTKFFEMLAVYSIPKMQKCGAVAPHMSTCGASTAAQPISGVHVNTSTVLENLLIMCACTASSNSGRKSMWKSNLSWANEVVQYVSCESSAVSADTSGNHGKAEWSTSSKCQSNCVVYAGKSECTVVYVNLLERDLQVVVREKSLHIGWWGHACISKRSICFFPLNLAWNGEMQEYCRFYVFMT